MNGIREGAVYKKKKIRRTCQQMEEGLFMIEKDNTWQLFDKPQGRKVIGVKWVFRAKLNFDGSMNKHKAKF